MYKNFGGFSWRFYRGFSGSVRGFIGNIYGKSTGVLWEFYGDFMGIIREESRKVTVNITKNQLIVPV